MRFILAFSRCWLLWTGTWKWQCLPDPSKPWCMFRCFGQVHGGGSASIFGWCDMRTKRKSAHKVQTLVVVRCQPTWATQTKRGVCSPARSGGYACDANRVALKPAPRVHRSCKFQFFQLVVLLRVLQFGYVDNIFIYKY